MTSGKKVLLIGSAYPFRGGLATFNERLIREYRLHGNDASIYTFTIQYPGILFPGKTQYSTEPAPPDISILRKVNSINPLNWIHVGLEIKKQKPDLVLIKFWIPFMAPCFGTICRIIRSNGHTRVIAVIDNIIPHEHRLGDHLLSSYFVNSVDGFVAMSKSVMDDLNAFNKVKPKAFCPHPLYDNFGFPLTKIAAKQILHLDERFNYILFFGFIRDYKGLDLLLEAMADEQLRKLPLKLLVAGEFYCDPQPYFDLLSKYNLKESVILSNDFIPDSAVRNYFCAADIVVQPYKSATQSGVTQIAYHFNKPMIVTDVGGLSEIVPHEKVGYVVPSVPADIASAILRFYRENKEVEFSAHAAVEKEKYSWMKMVEAIDSIMDADK